MAKIRLLAIKSLEYSSKQRDVIVSYSRVPNIGEKVVVNRSDLFIQGRVKDLSHAEEGGEYDATVWWE